ncbi:hypothetical protein [Paraburkholderia unamae]|uniref:hypothetical protein n=1 Tax=Paraburkholderia unamae TaxID=219649 RepID=UPI001CC480A1|nr:hypothetical protein [Paraburkholderia unamae]
MKREALEQLVAAAVRAEHSAACASARRRVAWRRRVVFVGATIIATWAMGEFVHLEIAHEGVRVGIDGLVACLIEKACFGIE